MLVQAACLVCLAHGANDVANSIAPLLVQVRSSESKANNYAWVYWLGGAGIAAGLLAMGWRVMETIGEKVIKLDYYKAFACQISTAVCVILGTRLSLPLSTTHCMVGALFGVGVCEKLDLVKRAYRSQQHHEDEDSERLLTTSSSG